MINSSNWYMWNRLAAKSLDQLFVSEIINGLNCSPFEAEAVFVQSYTNTQSFYVNLIL